MKLSPESAGNILGLAVCLAVIAGLLMIMSPIVGH
jgi:hypothetical protein